MPLEVNNPEVDNGTTEMKLAEFTRLNNSRPWYLARCNDAFKAFKDIKRDCTTADGDALDSDQAATRVKANFEEFTKAHETYKPILLRMKFLLTPEIQGMPNGRDNVEKLARHMQNQEEQFAEQSAGLHDLEQLQLLAKQKRAEDQARSLALINARAEAEARAAVEAELTQSAGVILTQNN